MEQLESETQNMSPDQLVVENAKITAEIEIEKARIEPKTRLKVIRT